MTDALPCTDLCTRLNGLTLENGRLPNHEELVSHLRFSERDKTDGRCLGTICELQERRQCAFCQLVVSAAIGDKDVGNESQLDPHETVNVFVFPKEQSFRLSYPSRLGTRLAFVAQDESQVSGPDNVRPIIGSEESSRILGWLGKCDEHHGNFCFPHPNNNLLQTGFYFDESATSNFRVIDLELGCVRRVPLSFKYVALSYVWGQLPMLKLFKNNLDQLTTEGALLALRSELPKTVNDAIDIVTKLNERYLWVDALCLVQDDPQDVRLGIEIMNYIYQGSYFTIIAGSGKDADSGLRHSAHGSKSTLRIPAKLGPGLKMTVLHSIDWHLRRSIYSSRGWTLQELVLPRRAIIFINDQVYFRCQAANWSEETWADNWARWLDDDDFNISRIPHQDEGEITAFWAYQKLSENYSQRTLRFDGDALRAMAGILRPLATRMQTMMLEGLPAAFLDMVLLFIASRGNLQRRPAFPSFSWAGWSGQILWPRENYCWIVDGKTTWDPQNLSKWLIHATFVKWSAWQPSGRLDSLYAEPYNGPSRLEVLVDALPKVFSSAAVEALKTTDGPLGSNIRSYSLISRQGEDLGDRPKAQAALNGLGLPSSEAAFRESASQIGSPTEIKRMRNWMASREARRRKYGNEVPFSQRRSNRPKSAAHERGASDYRLRGPVSIEEQKEDQRGKNVRGIVEGEPSNHQGNKNTPKSIPVFPPYAVLRFRTISIHLFLGHLPKQSPHFNSHPTTEDHIPSIPLLSSSTQVIGSLYLDNLDHLPTGPNATIECLLLSRCLVPTAGSALLDPALAAKLPPGESVPDSNGQVWEDLFWVMYIVWDPVRNGIAERRGIGQVLAASALEIDDQLPAPEIKTVLLG